MIFRQLYGKVVSINVFSADFYTNLYPYPITFYRNISVLYNIYILFIKRSDNNASSKTALFVTIF